MSNTPQAGWLYAEGDPVGTVRWWDGSQWVGDPQSQATAQAPASSYEPAAVGYGAPAAAGAGAVDMAAFDWFKHCIQNKYADFSGRARRAEYWWFTLFSALIAIGLIIVAVIFAQIASALGIIMFIITGLFWLAILVPSLAVTWRRLHDTNKSGWWYLLSLVPFGSIVMIVFLATDGDRGPNQYGASPKY